MSLDPVAFLPPAYPVNANGVSLSAPGKLEFSSWLTQQVDILNRQLVDSDNQLRSLALGEAENLHQVMISLEKAKVSFELALQVRNKLLEAYQEIMRMQI